MVKKYGFKAKHLNVRQQTIVVDAYTAFHKFVVPALSAPSWPEDGKNVTDTGMRPREWAGLSIHCLSLMDLTGQPLKVGKDFRGGDGVLIRVVDNKKALFEGVYVEQTLATYIAHNDLQKALQERIMDKSSRGENYSFNMHLIVWCNINGDFNVPELEELVAKGSFNIVNVIGFNRENRLYLSLVFDKDEGLIHRFAIREQDLINYQAG